MLYNPRADGATPTITGQFLARIQYSPRRRAEIAADLMSGAKQLAQPTVGQAAALCRVSAGAIHKIRRDRNPTAIKKRTTVPVPADLVVAWRNASATERLDFIRAVGVDAAFDVVVAASA